MRVLVFIALYCVLEIVAAAGAGTSFSAEHERAAEFLKAERWESATRIYREIMARGEDDPLLPNACLGLARSLAGGGSDQEALSILRALPVKLSARRREVVNHWRYTAFLERARILGRQGKVDAALSEFRNAVAIIGEGGINADLRVRARVEAAELLTRADRRKEAIALLSAHLDELGASQFSGLRAYQLAVLARIYMADGERDWAVSLLERIREDPELDELQFKVAEALVEGRDWKRPVTGKLRTRRGPGTFRIESEGRFELGVELQAMEGDWLLGDEGAIAVWFNLENDPFKSTNLVGPPGGCLLCLGIGKERTDRNQRVAFEVIEDLPVRVRFRARQIAWPHRVDSYSIYPTGQICVRSEIELGGSESPERIKTLSLQTMVNGRVNWMQSAADARCMIGERLLLHESPYHLVHSNLVPAPRQSMPDDLLLVPALAGKHAGIFMPEDASSWSRSVMTVPCGAAADRHDLALQVRVYPRTMDSFFAGKTYVDDYQSPAEIEILVGAVVKDDPGDLNGDGYNESEGCYVVSGTIRASLIAGQLDRHQPVLKFLGVKVQGIPDLEVNGKIAAAEAYNLARLGKDSFLVQWLGVVKMGERIEFSLK